MRSSRAFFSSFVVAILTGSCGGSSPEDDVRAAWAEFKAATLSGAGDVAASRVTNATHEYFGELRTLALEAERAHLETLVLERVFSVLLFRARLSRAELERMTGRDLYAHAVAKGWVGKNDTGALGIGDVEVIGDSASAMSTKVDVPTGLKLHFIRQDGAWRVDVMNLMKYANVAIDAMRKKSGLSEEEFLATMIQTLTGKKLTGELWNPMR
jgi:hypothetical protein